MIYILWVWKLNTGKFCRCCKLSSTHHGHFDTNFDIKGIKGLGFGKLFMKFVRVEYYFVLYFYPDEYHINLGKMKFWCWYVPFNMHFLSYILKNTQANDQRNNQIMTTLRFGNCSFT